MNCHVQIFLDGRWKTATVFEPDAQKLDKGIAGGGRLQYDIDYAVTYLGNRTAELIPGLTVVLKELLTASQTMAILRIYIRRCSHAR